MRYFIEIAYNGENYHGWQLQPGAITVQEVMEKALSTLLRKELKLTGSGRTDTGVHAKQLFAHFDYEVISDFSELIFRLNSFLPKDIAVRNILEVPENAHARFDAITREYEYVISLIKDPFVSRFSYEIHNIPDMDAMNEAAGFLLPHRDFQCFSRSNTDVKTYYCEIKKAEWTLRNNQMVFSIAADRFLRNMVRAIVGTLLDIGFGKTSLSDFQQILVHGSRSDAGASAPAHGLFLTKVVYPKSIIP